DLCIVLLTPAAQLLFLAFVKSPNHFDILSEGGDQVAFHLRVTFYLSLFVAVFAQPPPAPTRAALDFRTIPRPPVPADALELVTGEAQPVQDAQQRIAAISLLTKAS